MGRSVRQATRKTALERRPHADANGQRLRADIRVRSSATSQLQEDDYRWDKPNRRFCLLEQDSLFNEALTRLQIREHHVKQGWSLILTVETDDNSNGLGVVDVWTRSGDLADTKPVLAAASSARMPQSEAIVK